MSEGPVSMRNGSREGTRLTSSPQAPLTTTDTPPMQNPLLCVLFASQPAWIRCIYDPTELHVKNWQPIWIPPPVDVLQCPKTASSGRRLIVVNRGGSYCFFPSDCFKSRFI